MGPGAFVASARIPNDATPKREEVDPPSRKRPQTCFLAPAEQEKRDLDVGRLICPFQLDFRLVRP